MSFLKKQVYRLIREYRWPRRLRMRIVFLATKFGYLSKQLSFRDNRPIPSVKPFAGKRVLVPIIETSHYQHQQMLALGKALELRGAEVMVLVCNSLLDGCEIKSLRNREDPDPCWSCEFNRTNITPLYELNTVSLSDFISLSTIEKIRTKAADMVSRGQTILMHGIKLDRAVEDSVIRYFYGKVPIDTDELDKVRLAHTNTALLTTEVAFAIDKIWGPDAVLNNIGSYSTWYPFFQYYSENGNRFNSVSLDSFNLYSIRLNLHELFKSTDRFSDYIKSRGTAWLSPIERAALQEFMKRRTEGRDALVISNGYFSPAARNIEQELSIDIAKRNVFIFPNIYWDIGLSERTKVYPDVISWIIKTIELLKDDPDVHVYIKPHPGEIYNSVTSLKGVSQVIQENFTDLPKNITVIQPELKIATYALFPYIDLGVIYTGTIGLEMLLNGIPVVSVGATSYLGLGFAAEPKTEREYQLFLLGKKELPRYSREDLELFAYFYFLRCSMPWTLTKQVHSERLTRFNFDSLDEILPGNDPLLDHLCSCILDRNNTVIEAWPARIK
jgi:hypothetical protein